MIRKLLRYCRGYVRLEITGVSLERFLNLCRARNVELWDIRRPSPDRMCLSVPAAGWREIEPICHRTMCEAAVVGRRGLALALRPFAGRHFLLLAACCCLLISLLSIYILMLSIFLLVQKNSTKLENLLLIGYSPAKVSFPYQTLTIALNLLVFLLAVALMLAVRTAYLDMLEGFFPDLQTPTVWPSVAAGLALLLLVSLFNVIVVRAKVMSIWKGQK